MGRWIGRSLIAVAVIHSAFALIAFRPTLADIVRRGVWNSVGEDPLRGAVAWFVLFGAVLLLFGIAIDALERSEAIRSAPSLAWGLLVLAVLGTVLMPVSGFWLVWPAVAGLFVKSTRRAG